MGGSGGGGRSYRPLSDVEVTSLRQQASSDIQKHLEKAKLIGRFDTLLKAPSDGDLRVFFLDVGQGNCTVIKMPDGRIMVIDCNTESANDNVVNFLKKAGVTQIDVLVATHPDRDHISGLARIAKLFDVKELWKVAFQKTEENASPESIEAFAEYERAVEVLRSKGAKIVNPTVETYDRTIGGATVEVLAPFSKNPDHYKTANDASMVLRVTHAGKSFLFTADTTTATWEKLIQAGNTSAAVLQASHHGAESGFHPDIMKTVKPDLVVVSVGKNPFGHPHPAPMNEYEKAPHGVVRTDDGLVAVHVKKDGATDFVQ
jgi:beta-lactamase superfamily II metal-dependent hydrolase